MDRNSKGVYNVKIEHILSPVPIRCHLTYQEELNITGTFDSIDKNTGLDQNLEISTKYQHQNWYLNFMVDVD